MASEASKLGLSLVVAGLRGRTAAGDGCGM